MPDDWEGFPMRKDYPVQINQRVKTYEPLQVSEDEFVANMEAARRSAPGSRADARGLMPPIDGGAAVAIVTRTLDAAIDTHRRVRGLDLTAVATAAATIGDGARVGPEGAGVRQRRQRGGCPASGHRAGRPVSEGAGGLGGDGADGGHEPADERRERLRVRARVRAAGRGARGGRRRRVCDLDERRFAERDCRAARRRAPRAADGRADRPRRREAGRLAEIHINVPDDCTARVQEVHITLIHAICEIVETGVTSGN